MAVENATYIKQLNPAYPQDEDLIKEGDDHIRLIKKTLRNTFKNLDGQVLLSTEQLNELISYKEYVKQQVEKVYPVGSLYFSVNTVDPGTVLGFGTWEVLAPGRMLLSSGTGTDDNGDSVLFGNGVTGGTYSNTLNTDNIPEHYHHFSFAENTSEGIPSYLDTIPVYKSNNVPESLLNFVKRVITFSKYVTLYGNPDNQVESPENPLVGDALVSRKTEDKGIAVSRKTLTNTSQNLPVNNMPPYIAVNIWKRTS